MSYNVQPILRECFKNGTEDAEIVEKVLHGIPNDVKAVTNITTFVTLGIGTLATIITIIFIFAVIKAIKNKSVSRKCYILILNRSFGDFFTAFSFALLSILRLSFVEHSKTHSAVLQILQYIINAAAWSEMISYNLLSGIKLYAVAYPLHYRHKFTLKRCIYLASLSWIIFLFIFFLHLCLYIFCEKCATIAGKIEDATSTGIYLFTIIFFVLTAIFVYRSKNFQDERSKKSRFPFSRFAIMFGVFIFFYSFIIAADIYFSYIHSFLSFCFTTLNQAPIAGIQEGIWVLILIRICLDPIINCIIDKKIKASAKSLFGFNSSITAPVSNQKNASKNSGPSVQSTNPSNNDPSSAVKI